MAPLFWNARDSKCANGKHACNCIGIPQGERLREAPIPQHYASAPQLMGGNYPRLHERRGAGSGGSCACHQFPL
jgi:hypothetical protein